MNSCHNCANRVYDEERGMVMCSVYDHRVKDYDKYIDCQSHNQKGADTNADN